MFRKLLFGLAFGTWGPHGLLWKLNPNVQRFLWDLFKLNFIISGSMCPHSSLPVFRLVLGRRAFSLRKTLRRTNSFRARRFPPVTRGDGHGSSLDMATSVALGRPVEEKKE